MITSSTIIFNEIYSSNAIWIDYFIGCTSDDVWLLVVIELLSSIFIEIIQKAKLGTDISWRSRGGIDR